MNDQYEIYVIDPEKIRSIDQMGKEHGDSYYVRDGCCPRAILHQFLKEGHLETQKPKSFLFVRCHKGNPTTDRQMLRSKALVTTTMIVA